MSSLTFNHSNSEGQQTIAVFGSYDGTEFNRVVPASHPSFNRLAGYLLEHAVAQDFDVEYVHGLVDPAVGIGRLLQESFGDRVTFDNRWFYLDGRKADGALGQHVRDKVLSGDDDWERLVHFLVRIDANPSRRAQDAVWYWIEQNGLTITEDGRFLGYKAVQNDGLSKHSGPNNYIDGVLYQNGEDTQVPHEIGTVVSKHRGDVDDTPGGGCSVGLHVGTEKYARSFAERLVTVAVGPEDVVSAPDKTTGNWDSLEFKIRVCRYEVVALADPVQFASTSYDVQTGEPDVTPESVEQAVYGEEGVVLSSDVDGVPLRIPSEGTGLFGRVVLRDWAQGNPALAADLADLTQGHAAVARKYSDITTESSVRRYRKSL